MKIQTSGIKQWALIAAVLLVCLGAWTGLLDNFAADYIKKSFRDTGIIFGTAMGINALISVLQGTELDLIFLSFSVGELLDPINDLVERFSSVMTVAMASIFIQKLLLETVSSFWFNIAATLSGAMVIIALLLGKKAVLIWRFFLFVVFLRFALSLVVAGNMWVDRTFLLGVASPEYRMIGEFEQDISQAEKLIRQDKNREKGDPCAPAKDTDQHIMTDAVAWLLQLKCKLGGEVDAVKQWYKNPGDKWISDKLAEIGKQAQDFADNAIRLIASVLLKSIVIPLLLFYGLVAALRRAWDSAANLGSDGGSNE